MSNSLTAAPLLLETIKIEDGIIFNLDYHQKRLHTSMQALYPDASPIHLKSLILPPKKGLVRCRILYANFLHSIEYIPYTPKLIRSLKVVSSKLSYNFKYAHRDEINTLLRAHTEVDDIIIEKKGYLTDTSIANIAFYDGETWVTPTNPLLKGTMRQKLIDEGFLQTRDIKKEDIFSYTQVALINAMIGFKILNHFNIHQD